MYTDETGEGIILAIATTLLVGAVIGGCGRNNCVSNRTKHLGRCCRRSYLRIDFYGRNGAGDNYRRSWWTCNCRFSWICGWIWWKCYHSRKIGNGWGNINLREVLIFGGISATVNMATFGMMNFAMRKSVGLFDNIFDKSLKFGTRLANSLALLATGMFSAPMSCKHVCELLDIMAAEILMALLFKSICLIKQ